MTPEEYINQAEDLLSSAENSAGRGYDSASIEANASRAAALSNIAHAYIALAQTASLAQAANSQTIIASEWRRPVDFSEAPKYGTPTPPVHDETVSDAPTDGRPVDGQGTPFSDNVGHFYVEMRIDAQMNHTDAHNLCKELFPRFSVSNLEVSPIDTDPDQKATFLSIDLEY